MSFDLKTALLALLLLAGLSLPQLAFAQKSDVTIIETRYGTVTSYGIKYNPETKSYFSLRHIHQPGGAGVGGAGWKYSNMVAEDSYFHGVKGHLAYVKTPETHEFLLLNFGKRVSSAWIGLRHYCKTGQNIWTDGVELKPGEFSAWHPTPWLPKYGSCRNGQFEFAGVFYTSFRDLFRWQASPWKHYLDQFIVEFPTGKP